MPFALPIDTTHHSWQPVPSSSIGHDPNEQDRESIISADAYPSFYSQYDPYRSQLASNYALSRSYQNLSTLGTSQPIMSTLPFSSAYQSNTPYPASYTSQYQQQYYMNNSLPYMSR